MIKISNVNSINEDVAINVKEAKHYPYVSEVVDEVIRTIFGEGTHMRRMFYEFSNLVNFAYGKCDTLLEDTYFSAKHVKTVNEAKDICYELEKKLKRYAAQSYCDYYNMGEIFRISEMLRALDVDENEKFSGQVNFFLKVPIPEKSFEKRNEIAKLLTATINPNVKGKR